MTTQLSTKERAVTVAKEAIITEAKRIEENCLFTSKGHFYAAQFWAKFHLWIGFPTVILAAVAGTAALAKFDKDNIWAGVLSIIVVILTSVTTFLNPKEKANAYLTAGNNYDSLLARTRMFWLIDCRMENSDEILTSRLKDLSEQRERLNRDCPQVPKGTYEKAKKGIEQGEADYKIDIVKKSN